ncbi:phage tail tape measure protein [Cetobacterium sp. 2A]|uniref:phage tail tape measure protein n=1 Tax=Cetobacterium sp. 2A TaxID=2754723 RepID=UPI00163CF4B5|nr:phage tail tape measure protein [Cetobacterium sp. 2A]MBC2855359.1 phage tail tape measure protein [Cetobacterium sp. 2A]
MARGKVMEMVMKLTTQMDKALPGNIEKISKEFNNLKNRQKQLNDISKMMPKNLSKNILEYQKMSSKLQMLNKIKTTNGSLTKEQEKEYKKLTSSQEKLGKVVDKERKAYQRYSMELTKLKIPHNQLQKEIKETAKELSNATAKQKLFNRASEFKKKAGSFAKKALITGGKAAAGAAIAGTMAAGYFTATSASQYADFEGQMKRVQAISGATKQEFNLLEKEALRLGATTSFTSKEAAQGMEKFALAGFKVSDIISAMPGMLNLAAASGENLTLVSDIVSDNMTAFGLEAKDAGRVADIFAYTMSRTNTGVEQLGESFKYVATQSEGLNVSIEESSAILGLLADKAMKGSQAGTGLGAVYTGILKDAKEFENLGIKLTDKKGEFVGTENFLKQLELFFKKQNIAGFKRQQMISKMFDARAARVVNALLDGEKEINGQVYKGVERISAQINATKTESVGAAERMKEIMLEGANGARTLFFSAVDGLKMAIGKTVFTENTLEKIKIATKYVSEFGLVLRGQLSDDPVNKFWQNMFQKIDKIRTKFKEILGPGFEALKSILMDPTLTKFFKDIGMILLKVAYIAACAFSAIAKGLKWINDAIGIDNILVFATAFATLSGIPLILGAITSGIATMIATIVTLGGPVLWIGAAIALIGYLMYKNWDSVKPILVEVWNNIVAIWESCKNWFRMISEIFKALNPLRTIVDLVKAFTDNWNSSLSIVDNLKKGFGVFFDGILEKISMVKTAFQVWTSSIADVPIVGSLLKKLSIETKADGSHKNGLSYVPYDGYVAELHKGERVLTAEENESFGKRILNNLRSTRESENSSDSYTNSNKEINIAIEGGNYQFNFPDTASMIPGEILKEMYDNFKKMLEENNKELERRVKDAVRTAI